MIKKILILSMVLMACSVISVRAEGDTPLYGTVREYYDNQFLKSFSTYEDGNQIEYQSFDKKGNFIKGFKRIYFHSGKVKHEENYKNGELVSPTLTYYENGQVKSEDYYENGKLNGTSKGYYEEGQVRYVTDYKNDSVHGTRTLYYKNGKVKSEALYIDNLQQGLTKEYNESGQLVSEKNFNKGILDGIQKKYEDESLANKTVYKKGKILSSVNYYPNGKPKAEWKYLENEMIYREYGELGNILSEKTYKDDVLKVNDTYDTYGNLLKKEEFKSDTLSVISNYGPNKILKEQETIQDGMLILYKEFYPSGELMTENIYKDQGAKITTKKYRKNGKLAEESISSHNMLQIKKYDEKGKLISDEEIEL